MVAVIGGVLALCIPAAAQAKDQSAVLPGTGQPITWRDGPFTAKDTRTLLWRTSRAGKERQKMNMKMGIMTRQGVLLKGANCGSNDTWLNYWEKSTTHIVGGLGCDGKKSFEKRPGYDRKRYLVLMDYISDQMFAHAKIPGEDLGTPLIIRANEKRALFLYSRASKDPLVHSIRAIRFDGDNYSIERF